MGWGRTLLLGHVGNRLDIEDVERDIARLRDDLRRTLDSDRRSDLQQDEELTRLRDRVATLEADLQEVTMYTAGLVELLVSHDVVSEAEFSRLVDVVDPPEADEPTG